MRYQERLLLPFLPSVPMHHSQQIQPECGHSIAYIFTKIHVLFMSSFIHPFFLYSVPLPGFSLYQNVCLVCLVHSPACLLNSPGFGHPKSCVTHCALTRQGEIRGKEDSFADKKQLGLVDQSAITGAF